MGNASESNKLWMTGHLPRDKRKRSHQSGERLSKGERSEIQYAGNLMREGERYCVLVGYRSRSKGDLEMATVEINLFGFVCVTAPRARNARKQNEV